MKKTRYLIHFDNIECDMVSVDRDFKREYDFQMKHLRDKVCPNHADNIEFWEHPTRIYESGHVTRIETCFAFACAVTTLTKEVCDDGYAFKNRCDR